MIEPGLMREKITIQKLNSDIDKIGNAVQKWQDFYYCKAYCNSLFGDEFYKAAEVGLQNTVKLITRYSKKIADIDTRYFRLIFRNKAYNINFIDNPNFKNEMLIISAIEKNIGDEDEQ